MREYKTASTEETEALARELAKELRPGDVLAFTGGMGAGKTAAQSIDEYIRSKN